MSRSGRVERAACGIGFVADAGAQTSRAVVEQALTGLACVRHRQAIAADGLSGDGAGLLAPIPRGFFARVGREALGTDLDTDRLGVITAFLDPDATTSAQDAVRAACATEGLELAGWRSVPIDEDQIGAHAAADLPAIVQGFVLRPADIDLAGAERRAYRARRAAEVSTLAAGVRCYFASFSFRTVTYKALVISDRLAAFYPDLDADDFDAPLAIFHSRFSTNTTPAWERAQPFRMLCHNGEINTLAGNENRMRARGVLGAEDAGLGTEDGLLPVLDPSDSDSGKLDATVELLVRGGRDVRHAIAMLVPEAWEGHRDLPPGVRDFFRYHASLTDPWDGPAGLLFTDGRRVGAALDRNGLRPLRYQVCDDGLVVCASEVGAVPISGHGRVRRGRLGPGQMLCVDPDLDERERVQLDPEVKTWLAAGAPYARWANDGLRPCSIGVPVVAPPEGDALVAQQVALGFNREEWAMVLKPMATDAKEPTFSMGDDAPFAAAAARPRPIFHFLKQRFAQVTNPPIDHLRERLVMSVRTCLGPRQPLLTERAVAARLLELPTFFMYPSGVDALAEDAPWPVAPLDATFAAADGPSGMARRIAALADEAIAAVRDGTGILVVSDRAVGPERAPIPSLLASGAVHHRLIEERIRQDASIVVDTGDARDTHAVATLLAFGADACCPRLALESVAAAADDGALGELDSAGAQAKYQAAIEDGVLKIMSKMGISTVDGYRGAQVFEALGLAPEVIDRCLRGTPAPVAGLGFDALAADVLTRHRAAYDQDPSLDEPGWVRHRKRGGEYHANNPDVVDALHAAAGVDTDGARDDEVGDGEASGNGAGSLEGLEPAPPEDRGRVFMLTDAAQEAGRAEPPEPVPDPAEMLAAHVLQRAIADGSAELYERFRELVESRPVTELRDVLEFAGDTDPIPLDEVESVEQITTRFSTGAMSHGALSKEAHETLAEAMNLIGGKSNCGEGGEDPYRYRTRGTVNDRNSRIKQIASGRFGVTPEYCAFADELNIKMAQGSKPGEGGQLPGHKVSAEIARLRHTQPGIGLISPPPHHDIYSIEDLAQLIYDLKQVNPSADVSVKLVAEDGVGTIAAGVVKALADVVQISGNNGGTGASPLSSIKHAGMPWELGLAEARQSLVDDGLRDRVRLRVDGGFRTGRDVLIAALLGADEYSFGTAAMIAEGCIKVRACHRDTCPTGVATQRPNLRAKFVGSPEGVARYLRFVAEEVRVLMASLGLRTLDDAIGRVDLLRPRMTGDERIDSLDLSPLLAPPLDTKAPRRFVSNVPMQRPRSDLDARLLRDGFSALWDGADIELNYEITNADRTVGASLGGAIGLEWGTEAPPGTVTARFTGTAGQSFGAFCGAGVTLDLTGEANDYVGKGLGGGRLVIRAPADDDGAPVLAGNTVLYGATTGKLYIAGRAGERFAVRNSGATAVVEGTGDHACEYMTGGTIVILGPVGYNLGAGMTGGQAYVHDPDGALAARMNPQLVEAARLDETQASELRFLAERHRELTGSEVAAGLLANWDLTVLAFWRVAPVGEVARIERANEGLVATRT